MNTVNWKTKAQIMIAQFRADYAYFSNDARFNELIEEFMQISEVFRETWPRYDVQVVTDCHKQWYDPRVGQMEFEHIILQPPNELDLKIMIYTASTDTACRLQSLKDTVQVGKSSGRNSI